jgi:hypothetical protein
MWTFSLAMVEKDIFGPNICRVEISPEPVCVTPVTVAANVNCPVALVVVDAPLTLSETAAPAMGTAGELLSMTRPVRVTVAPNEYEKRPKAPQIRKTARYFI